MRKETFLTQYLQLNSKRVKVHFYVKKKYSMDFAKHPQATMHNTRDSSLSSDVQLSDK